VKRFFSFKSKLRKKHLGLITISLVLLSLLALSTPKVFALYQSHNLESQGDLLLASNKYKEALNKYQISKSKTERKSVNEKIEEAEALLESELKYQEGKIAIEEENWDDAIKKLSLVQPEHKDYKQAKSLIDFAIGRLRDGSNKIKPTPVNNPTSTPIPVTATPTNTPEPQVETELVTIGNKQYQCRKDKANEIREAKIKRDEALQKVWDCTDKCFDDRFACEDDCKDIYAQDWDNEALESCYAGCRAISCNDICYLYVTQAGTREGILTSLINDYCQ